MLHWCTCRRREQVTLFTVSFLAGGYLRAEHISCGLAFHLTIVRCDCCGPRTKDTGSLHHSAYPRFTLCLCVPVRAEFVYLGLPLFAFPTFLTHLLGAATFIAGQFAGLRSRTGRTDYHGSSSN